MRLITDEAAETTIDRAFDQTAVHIHGKDDCPTCNAVAGHHGTADTGEKAVAAIHTRDEVCRCGGLCDSGEPCPMPKPRSTGNTFPEHLRRQFDRHVSPAILEQRILDLTDELRVANERIKAFEQFTANLAAHIDGMQQAVNQAIKPTEFPKAA